MVSAFSINLISGGLDSILACKVLQGQGVRVKAVRFYSVFFPLRGGKKPQEVQEDFLNKYGIEILLEEVTQEFLEVVRSPEHGYGRWLNPCIDCKIFMYRKAGEMMKRECADFIATGEVLNQRRMSQHGRALKLIEKESGLEGLVERPLSGRLLSPTRAQEKGLLDRDKLLDFIGRRRDRQMALARELGITDYPTPAGGCLLTDETFARRVKDLFVHNSADAGALQLLNTGRHFRLSETARLIVGRNEAENDLLESFYSSAAGSSAVGSVNIMRIDPVDVMGPTALLIGEQEVLAEDAVGSAASVVARYSDGEGEVRIVIRSARGETVMDAARADEPSLEARRI
jgi:tRNA U34 2-thiouridine synthase MnmA/TrmU